MAGPREEFTELCGFLGSAVFRDVSWTVSCVLP